MDRNVITISRAAATNASRVRIAKEHAEARLQKSGLLRVQTGVEAANADRFVNDLLGGDSPVQDREQPDSWYARLMKLIPSEAISLYLALDRAVRPSTDELDPNLKYWLTGILAFTIAFNIIYLKRVWHVQGLQVAVSTVALIAYVYVSGGVFEVIGWAVPKAQSLVLIATAAGLSLFPDFAFPDKGTAAPDARA